MSTEFNDIVCGTIHDYDMLGATDNLIVGLSGGADSISLLHFLNNFIKMKCMGVSVKAVHINHCLRGEEAVRDANFSRGFCESNGINFVLEEVDVGKFARENKLSTEEAGREIRYKIFNKYAGGENDKIAVAHTMSDSCETFIMNLIRGSGTKGLCGIPAVRGKIIRPLIRVSRKQVEEYCLENGLEYINDSTNFEKYYMRNKIRLDILPKMKIINKSIENTLSRTMSLIKSDEEYLNEIAEEKFYECRVGEGFDINFINRQHFSIKSRMVIKILRDIVGFSNIESKMINLIFGIIEKRSGNVNISSRWRICVKDELLYVKEIRKKELKKSYSYGMKIGKNILTEFKKSVKIENVSSNDYKKIKKDFKNTTIWGVDHDKLNSECEFRNRRNGDKFSISDRNITKSVKKYFNELKIPADQRDDFLFLADGSNIVWSETWGVSRDYEVGEGTKNVMILEIC